MNLTRRDFIKGGASASVFLVPGMAGAATLLGSGGAVASATDGPLGTDLQVHIEKSIKAGFGGGFALRGHRRSGGLTYAEIEHRGNRYTVSSADHVDWSIISVA